MRVLVIGSGGREHALLLGLAADPSVTELFVAPGNAGTEAIATNHPVDASSGEAVVAFGVATLAGALSLSVGACTWLTGADKLGAGEGASSGGASSGSASSSGGDGDGGFAPTS